jgi:transglutaminase-like putative cysteine protease
MLLRLTHTTDLTYSDLISESVMELRMAPRQEGDQHRLSFDLAIGPDTQVGSYFDWLGNIVHAFSISRFHSQIQIVATSVVETERAASSPAELPDLWPLDGSALPYEMWDFLTFGGPVVDCGQLSFLASSMGAEKGERLGEIGLRLLERVHTGFTYERGITSAASPITDILLHGKGVCQDFTHLLIGLARNLGIPARYVSGLVHPDASKYRGFTQTHAWAELYFPSEGWVGFDPANNCVVGDNFVKVAVGRDFRDVPPNKGLYRGKSKETIDVRVHTEELEEIPPELVAERFRRIEIPSYVDGATAHREFAAQQQQIQQQQ